MNISQTIEHIMDVRVCVRVCSTRNEENRIEIWFLFTFRLVRSFVRFAFIY